MQNGSWIRDDLMMIIAYVRNAPINFSGFIDIAIFTISSCMKRIIRRSITLRKANVWHADNIYDAVSKASQ